MNKWTFAYKWKTIHESFITISSSKHLKHCQTHSYRPIVVKKALLKSPQELGSAFAFESEVHAWLGREPGSEGPTRDFLLLVLLLVDAVLSIEWMAPSSASSTTLTPSAKARQKSACNSWTMALLLKMMPSLKRIRSKSSMANLKEGKTGRVNCRMLMRTKSPSINFSRKAQTSASVPMSHVGKCSSKECKNGECGKDLQYPARKRVPTRDSRLPKELQIVPWAHGGSQRNLDEEPDNHSKPNPSNQARTNPMQTQWDPPSQPSRHRCRTV